MLKPVLLPIENMTVDQLRRAIAECHAATVGLDSFDTEYKAAILRIEYYQYYLTKLQKASVASNA